MWLLCGGYKGGGGGGVTSSDMFILIPFTKNIILALFCVALQVKANDRDGYFNTTSYTILSGNDEGFFTINSISGVVTTTGPIDRETAEDNFILKIQASDSKSSYSC